MQTFPHSSLSAQDAEVLTLLAEEASELAIECSKILRSGSDFCRRGRDVPNNVHLTTEFVDLMVLARVAMALGFIKEGLDMDQLAEAKIEKLKQWSGIGDLAEAVCK